MKSYLNRAIALMISILLVFSVVSPAFAYTCVTHDWGNWKITKVATCEEKGEMTRSCKRLKLLQPKKTTTKRKLLFLLTVQTADIKK